MVTATDDQASRAILGAYAELAQPWMDHADGQMGRKLPGLINMSPLRLAEVAVESVFSIDLAGDALARVDEIVLALIGAADHGLPDSTITSWRNDLDDLSASGQFFFAEPIVIVASVL